MNAERDRDRAMDELLRRTLCADAGARASEACLDAETVAAWMDDGLDAHALAAAEAHVAGCARCQAMVGVLVRTTAAVPTPASWWQRNRGMRWLVPLAAGAAAVALWMVVPEPRQPAMPSIQNAPEQARAEAPASAAVAAPAEPPEVSQPARPSEAEQAPGTKVQAEPRGGALNKEVGVASSQVESAPKLDTQGVVGSMAMRVEERGAAAPPEPAAPAAAPPVTPLAAAPGRVRQQQAGQDTAPIEIVSPDPSVRWRLGARGAVEYSASSGAAWESLSTGIAAELTAGSSPSPTVCWLVGRGGIILLTTDGRRWQRLPFTEAADLSSVEATDARTAAVTTADGRAFRTSDAGQTWRR